MRKKVIAFAWLCLYFLAGIAQVVWKIFPVTTNLFAEMFHQTRVKLFIH